jgi:hypothetical protein
VARIDPLRGSARRNLPASDRPGPRRDPEIVRPVRAPHTGSIRRVARGSSPHRGRFRPSAR